MMLAQCLRPKQDMPYTRLSASRVFDGRKRIV
jgi:hypothetical protein